MMIGCNRSLLSPSSSTTRSPPLHSSTIGYHKFKTSSGNFWKTVRTPTTAIRLSLSDNQTVAVTPTTTAAQSATENEPKPASEVVRSFYEGINDQDLASVEDLIAENCVYEDLIFPQPFVGRKKILEFFKKFIYINRSELRFVIDDISTEDSAAVGVTWHLEWKKRPFPFSKGCSFYRLEIVNGKRQIIYGRDSVEPAFKPGETALVVIRGVTWLLKQFPQLVNRLP
ncbi:uncharacterized protein LOC110818682 [Carica papaya]|uniref:uncharacterized protein LOC110818682 n=1 Tax=Carica papaya TaxID=3649 RepID=UPI000B8CF55B|nr:uncharacterized protein LOC110818682 [Carica papaya]